MKLTRLLGECFSFLLCALFLVPFIIFINYLYFQNASGFSQFAAGFLLLSLAGYVSGRLSATKNPGVSFAACLLSALFAGAIPYISLGILSPISAVISGLSLLLSICFFFLAHSGDYLGHPRFTMAGIIVYVIAIIAAQALGFSSNANTLLRTFGLIYFLLCLYSFNALGLRKSMHKNSTGLNLPAGLRGNNLILITCFIGFGILLTGLYPIFQGLLWLLSQVGKVFPFIQAFFNWISHLGSDATEPPSTPGEAIEFGGSGGVSRLGNIVFYIIVAFCIILVVTFIIVLIINVIRKGWKGLPNLFKNLRNLFQPNQAEDYEDETKSLFDLRQFWENTTGKVKSTFGRIFVRPQKLKDMPDNRMKVRFVYKELLAKTARPGRMYQTANEFLAEEYDLPTSGFPEYYNEARYSSKDIPDEAVVTATEILKNYG